MPCLPDYDSPAALKQFLESGNMAMQKKFGQNFLVNPTCREKLVTALALQPGMRVWEVGPGLGAMTCSILEQQANLTVFEIDRGFGIVLNELFGKNPDFSLVPGDVLKTWKSVLADKGLPSRLFGNLPYNIAATILADMVTSGTIFDRCVITIQKEVAIRMAAQPGSGDYSSFSVLMQFAYDVKNIMDIAAGSFWPRPNVVSRAVLLSQKKAPYACPDQALFFSLVRGLFSSRRKTVYNTMKNWLTQTGYTGYNVAVEQIAHAVFNTAGIDPKRRAETLGIPEFLAITDAVKQYEHTDKS